MEPSTLVCFAVKEEASPFRKMLPSTKQTEILITGMGRHNAERTINEALERMTPKMVFTCGFAGGLNPEHASGTVLFSSNGDNAMSARLAAKGLKSARFHMSDRVATTVAEKAELFRATGADAVEMESGPIANICAKKRIFCVTFRVILDSATEDLPLDFNRLMTSNLDMDYWKLAKSLLCAPGKIPALIQLQKQSKFAANQLAEALVRVI